MENNILSFIYSMFYMGISLACVFVHHIHAWCPQRPEEGMKSLALELQMFVDYHVGVSKQTWVLWKSRHYS